MSLYRCVRNRGMGKDCVWKVEHWKSMELILTYASERSDMVRHSDRIVDSTFNSPERFVAWHRHPQLRQLVFSPLEEQTALRGDTIGTLKAQVLTADKIVSLGLPPMLGNQSELNISFARPASVHFSRLRPKQSRLDFNSATSVQRRDAVR